MFTLPPAYIDNHRNRHNKQDRASKPGFGNCQTNKQANYKTESEQAFDATK